MSGNINKVEKLIINLDMQKPVVCNWDECDRLSRTSHQVRLHEHEGTCNSREAQYGRHVIMTFCSESHLDYWVASSGWRAHDTAARNRGQIYGQHSAGNRRMMF